MEGVLAPATETDANCSIFPRRAHRWAILAELAGRAVVAVGYLRLEQRPIQGREASSPEAWRVVQLRSNRGEPS
jgi:hypothetical protein